mgnify:CR=1 FL=1
MKFEKKTQKMHKMIYNSRNLLMKFEDNGLIYASVSTTVEIY